MALVGLTRLNKKDFLTADIWNALIDVLEAKFAGGVGTADITYPLVVQGDIDFSGGYGIVGLRSFWNIVNAAEYASLDAAVSAVEATGGGTVFIPPYTTISANNVSIDSSNVTIFGCGPTSVIQVTAAATGPLLTTATSGITDVGIKDLTLDGTGAGAGCVGVKFQRVTRARMRGVYMLGFTGDFIQLTNGGVAGQSCVDALLQDVHMSGGSDNHVFADDVSGLVMNNVTSKGSASDSISMVPASSSHLIQDVVLNSVRVHTSGAKGIRIIGSGATGIDAHSRIRLSNCQVIAATGLPYELGTTSALLKDVTVDGCSAPDSLSDGMRVASNGGVVAGNNLSNATSDGLDISDSVDLWAHGNNCIGAEAYGINADSTTTCTVVGNNCKDATTDGINRTDSTSLRAMENVGDDGPTVGNVLSDFAAYSVAGAGTGDIGFSYVIPAGTFKTGDAMRIRVFTNSGTSGTVELRADGTALSSWINNANSAMVDFTIRPATGGANTNTIRTNLREGPTVQVGTAAAVIDWTVDVTITFQVTANSGGTNINGVFVEMMGSK